MIKTAVIVSDESKVDEIGLNNIVELYFEEEDEVEEFKIVTTVRGNSLKNLVSTESPIGKAVLGHKVGDRVSHPKFGAGRVERIDPLTTDHKVTIIFDTYGTKTLLANFAKLTKL